MFMLHFHVILPASSPAACSALSCAACGGRATQCLTEAKASGCVSCAARKCPDGSLEWGKYSEESHYATAGKAPVSAPCGSGSGSLDAGKRPKKRDAAVRRSNDRRPQQGSTAGSQELDEEEAHERMQVTAGVQA